MKLRAGGGDSVEIAVVGEGGGEWVCAGTLPALRALPSMGCDAEIQVL